MRFSSRIQDRQQGHGVVCVESKLAVEKEGVTSGSGGDSLVGSSDGRIISCVTVVLCLLSGSAARMPDIYPRLVTLGEVPKLVSGVPAEGCGCIEAE